MLYVASGMVTRNWFSSHPEKKKKKKVTKQTIIIINISKRAVTNRWAFCSGRVQ